MINQESKTSKAQQKARIRERYKGIDPDVLEVIPARKRADFYDDEPRRVAVYVRVSTDDPRQTSSYELQKNYYEDIVQRHETWTLVDIYADEGISGTSLQHRDAFNRMISDCKAGKIDMIITKSVSRFARNIVDCISIVRELGALNPPIGIFFETEHIFTLKDDTEMGLSFQATMAQEESHIKSNIMNASIEMRFSHGIVLTPVLLGYDHDEDGNLVINEEEAETVRLIFFMYLYGYTCQQIAETLTELERKTKKGNTTWSSSSVLQQLRNERHCGEVLTRKTFTPSYLNHKAKKNVGDRTQHRWRDHHEAIIPRDDFIALRGQAAQGPRQIGAAGGGDAEGRAHGGPQGLGGKGVRRLFVHQQAGKARGVHGAQDGSHVAGVLHPVQRHQPGAGAAQGGFPRQIAQGDHPLGRFGVAQGGKHVGGQRIRQ